jgi:hypothetical protein
VHHDKHDVPHQQQNVAADHEAETKILEETNHGVGFLTSPAAHAGRARRREMGALARGLQLRHPSVGVLFQGNPE